MQLHLHGIRTRIPKQEVWSSELQREKSDGQHILFTGVKRNGRAKVSKLEVQTLGEEFSDSGVTSKLTISKQRCILTVR